MFGWFRKRSARATEASTPTSGTVDGSAAPSLAGAPAAPQPPAPQPATPEHATAPRSTVSTSVEPPSSPIPTVASPAEPAHPGQATEPAAEPGELTEPAGPAVGSTVGQPGAAASTEAESDEAAAAAPPAANRALERPSLAGVDDDYPGLIHRPSARPAMPLSAHPNFAGLGLALPPQRPPRMLDPEAALTPAAQEQLRMLFEDLFGPNGRYRLEWRTDRNPGDDAVFSEIMAADLVRRVQNTIADVAELERPEPLRAITAGSDADAERSEDEAPSCGSDDDELKRAS